MKKIFEVLKNVSIFDNIPPDSLGDALDLLKARKALYKKGSPVFLEGSPADFVGLVLSGKIHIIKEDYYGNRNIVAEVCQGELFGEVFACAGIAAIPVSVLAADDSEVLLMDFKSMFMQPADKTCDTLLSNLLKIVANKTLQLNQKIDILSKRTTREKILAYLSMQIKACGSPEFIIPFNRQELADFLCVERSAMSAELGRMKRYGLIDFKKNKFRML